MLTAMENCMVEISFESGRDYDDPFHEVKLDVTFEDEKGNEQMVPAFWAGDNVWKVRFAAADTGKYQYQTICSDSENQQLHNQEGTVKVVSYNGNNILKKHGPLQISDNKRYFEHEDKEPFLWLADTWWMGFCKRLKWPEEFKELTNDRVNKDFSVIQIIAGLYPDMPPFDERGANEAGFPWAEDFSTINPAYFDMVDLRIGHLVNSGLVPCIVGSWGYFYKFAGVEVMKKHWRYLIARYGAYPVVWCAAGEALMPYYLDFDMSETEQKQYREKAREAWAEVARYIHDNDDFNRPLTIHSCGGENSRDMIGEVELIDFDMLQTGHGGKGSVPNTVNQIVESYEAEPTMPVIDGEVCYEGILGSSLHDVQRIVFWSCILSGAAGHTYGANGIWQVNREEEPFGKSPHGKTWGYTPWNKAYKLAGSGQIGMGKQLLEKYQWWQFEPHREWIEPHWTEDDYFQPYAAGIPGQVRIFYLPSAGFSNIMVKDIEDGVDYEAYFFNPVNGQRQDIGQVAPDDDGKWRVPEPPVIQDWVLVFTVE